VGVDFGTSNSAAAVLSGDSTTARVLELDQHAEDARLYRSVLFFPENSAEILSGALGIEQYLSEGEGRFLQSVKTFLPSSTFQRTEIRRKSWKLEEIVGEFLRHLRKRIEHVTGAPIGRAVFGRPAVFSPDPEKDRLAESRLAAAATLAGFPKPVFVIEPIAAALRYEESLDHDEVVLVGDFGAGTSDFTLMRLGPSYRENLNRREDVIASSGVYVGGDRFDAAIVEHRLLPRFGSGSTFQSLTKRLPIPVWMTRKLLAWNELALLRERSTMEFLEQALRTSDQREALQNLITLAQENLGYRLYREVEHAKRTLSSEESATVSFQEADIHIEERVTRDEFECWTAPLRDELTRAMDRVFEKAGQREPDAIFLTGGTSRVPSVRQLFIDRFGADRVREGDAFTSVAAGLGRAAANPRLDQQERWDSETIAASQG
jgi:hypothetical chaperone protein